MATKQITIKNLKNKLSFYILYGLYKAPEAVYSITYIKESFLPFKRQRVLDQLWQYCKTISVQKPENVLGMFYEGWKYFKGKDLYTYYIEHNKEIGILHEKYPIDPLRLIKCILLGFGTHNWYQKTRADFFSFYSQPDYDTELLLKIFAITSPNENPGSNLARALKAYECLTNPLKSLTEMTGFENVRNMLFELETGEFDTKMDKATRRKVVYHWRALKGETNVVVVDSWMLYACVRGKLYFWKSKGKFYWKCRKREYDMIEYYVTSLAQSSGFFPTQITSMVWAGARYDQGKYTETDMEKIILRKKRKNRVA